MSEKILKIPTNILDQKSEDKIGEIIANNIDAGNPIEQALLEDQLDKITEGDNP